MGALVREIRRSGAFAASVAGCLLVVLAAGVIAALVRAGGRDTVHLAQRPRSVPAGWLRVVDRSVGFAAWLPRRATDLRQAVDGFPVRLARTSYRITIERIAIPGMSATVLTRAFRGAVDSLAFGAGLQVVSEATTTFRGGPAREGVYLTDNGSYYRALSFVAGAGEVCVIAAPARYFGVVTTDFQLLGPKDRSP